MVAIAVNTIEKIFANNRVFGKMKVVNNFPKRIVQLRICPIVWALTATGTQIFNSVSKKPVALRSSIKPKI